MSGALYAACRGIVEAAVESGVCGPDEAWKMTPVELMLRIRAHEKAQVRRLKEMDLLAWLIGQYCAVGINAPGRYPAEPDRVRDMASGDDEMQDLMRALASKNERGGGE